jgi:anhydro-N-acetylmuramic acid kinase
MLTIGMMSGTSLDGIDVALVEVTEERGEHLRVSLLDFFTEPYQDTTVRRIRDAMSLEKSHTLLICQLNVELGKCYGKAAQKMMARHHLKAEELAFIANHGQTIYHHPISEFPSTLQIGEAAEIAAITGVKTISNFREADIAAGGQGAPIVPFTEYQLYRSSEKDRLLVNIGGISNLTVIPKGGDLSSIIAFDTGPGNMMIDAAMQKFYQKGYDKNGAVAAQGIVNQTLLNDLMRHPYLAKNYPKTTGREVFGEEMTEKLFQTYQLLPEDWVATLTAFTAQSLCQAINAFSCDNLEVMIAGGGAYNTTLMHWIQAECQCDIMTQEELGYSSEAKEAIAMAILGKYTLEGKSNNVPSATGARQSVILGKITNVHREEN